MISPINRLLIVVMLSALPSFVFAAENAPAATEQKSPTALSAPAEPAPAVKAPETAVPRPVFKVGYVDLARISAEAEVAKTARTKAQEKQKTLQGQLESKRKQLEKQKAALEAKFATLSQAQKESKAKAYQKKVEEFQSTVQKAEKELQDLQVDLEKQITTAVEAAAVEYGKAGNLSLVIVKRELLYMAPAVETEDVTEGILKIMNKDAKK